MLNLMVNSKKKQKRLKLGIVANEFFDLSIGRMGGFGWATRQVTKLFNENSDYRVEIVFISGQFKQEGSESEELLVHNTRFLVLSPNRIHCLQQLRKEKIDLLLSIDYRPSYQRVFSLLPRTPILVWVRDPRPPEDVKKIHTTRIPGQGDCLPQGLKEINCTGLKQIVQRSRWLKRPVLFATPSSFLIDKIPGTYGYQPRDVTLLPNIINLDPGAIVKSKRPRVVFLGRLDPYKRPWLFVELAQRFPSVEFLMLGQAHVHGTGAWKPTSLPSNVRILGHVEDETEKARLLASAWVLINTSIHEGLAVSFQEALRCETPLLSCVNPEEVVSRFGIFVGRWDGTGMEGLPKFVEGLTRLLSDESLRIGLGKEGRAWVERTHSHQQFLKAFSQLCRQANVSWSLDNLNGGGKNISSSYPSTMTTNATTKKVLHSTECNNH